MTYTLAKAAEQRAYKISRLQNAFGELCRASGQLGKKLDHQQREILLQITLGYAAVFQQAVNDSRVKDAQIAFNGLGDTVREATPTPEAA